uniref:Uncharacterized protein n=1 Tax=Anguilla anguilla TaxID=7936 RepID=A0A0E9QPW3_ANGAN
MGSDLHPLRESVALKGVFSRHELHLLISHRLHSTEKHSGLFMTGTVNRRVKTCPRPQSTLTVWSTRG